MLWIITGILVSYGIGSVPTAYLFCRLLKGIDIRTVGSGNVGATNASRILGKKLGITVLLLDIVKGILAVTVIGDLFFSLTSASLGNETYLRLVFGISAVCGHNWPVFLAFKGGKGVATTLGVLIGLAISVEGLRLILAYLVVTWLIVFLITRIVSIASVAAAISFPVYMFLFKRPFLLLAASIILSTIVVLKHTPNLKRFREGKENKLF